MWGLPQPTLVTMHPTREPLFACTSLWISIVVLDRPQILDLWLVNHYFLWESLEFPLAKAIIREPEQPSLNQQRHAAESTLIHPESLSCLAHHRKEKETRMANTNTSCYVA